MSIQLPYQGAHQRVGVYIGLPTSGLLPPHIRQVLQPRMNWVIRGQKGPAAAGRGGRSPSLVGITGYSCEAGRARGNRSRGRHQCHRGTLGWGRGGEYFWRSARPTGGLPGPAPLAPGGLQKPLSSSVSRGRKLSFAAREGTAFSQAPPRRTRPRWGGGRWRRAEASEPTPKFRAGPQPPNRRGGWAPHAPWRPGEFPAVVRDSPPEAELIQALSLRNSLEAYTPLLAGKALMRWRKAGTLSCCLQTKRGTGSELHALCHNCRENQNRKPRNSEQDKPGDFKPEKEWAEPTVSDSCDPLFLVLGTSGVST